MKFGPYAVNKALDGILAHRLVVGERLFVKGARLTQEDLEYLQCHCIKEVTIAKLECDDIDENTAADVIAKALCGNGLQVISTGTGRANLVAVSSGTVCIKRQAIDQLNLVSESIMVATRSPFDMVKTSNIIATIKIVPYAIESRTLNQALSVAEETAISISDVRPLKACLIQTLLPGTLEKMLVKTRGVTSQRLEKFGGALKHYETCLHDVSSLASTLLSQYTKPIDMIIIAGASAIADRRDVIPSAIEATGGTIRNFGLPVDPGNLLLLAEVNEIPIIGIPGCARSPKLNGLDFILHRLFFDLPLDNRSIASLGCGGLLRHL